MNAWIRSARTIAIAIVTTSSTSPFIDLDDAVRDLAMAEYQSVPNRFGGQ
jgi:hypothetical protein